MSFHFSIQEAIKQLEKETEDRSTVLVKHGTMSIEYYAPKNVDPQMPHAQDEIYVIASGTAKFFRDGERVHCKTGDVLFVPAKMVHRFETFSDDFATWVIFYGKEGGEAS
jgi:mannose-6-phosphate isomerase-like protein (cupin superfamily)